MKKLLVMLLSSMLVLGLAASAMAEVAINGSYRARFWYAADYDMTDSDVDDPMTFVDNRLRTLLDIKVAENVQVFGNFDLTERRWGGSVTDVNNQNFQVNEGYLKFLVPNTPLWFQVGRQDVTWYYGVVGAYADYRDRLKAWVDLKDVGLNIGAAMDQFNEALSTSYDDDDYSAYSGWVKFKVAGWDLGAIFIYGDNGFTETNITTGVSTENDSQTWSLGVGANGAAGPVKIGAEAAMKGGTVKTRVAGSGSAWKEVDQEAMGGVAILSMPAGPVGLALALAYASGDDITTDENEGFNFDADGPFNGVILFANNWAPEIAPLKGFYAADKGFGNGYGAKLSASFSPIKPLTLGAAALYAIAAEDVKTASGVVIDADAYGFEGDVSLSYDIAQNVNFMLAGGFLSPGNFLKDMGYENTAYGGMAKFEVKF